MNILAKIFKWCDKNIDKVVHMLLCFLLVIMLSLVFNRIITYSIVFVIAIAKEIFDQFRRYGWSFEDMIANVIGILMGILYLECNDPSHF